MVLAKEDEMKKRYSAQCGKNRYSDEGYAIRNAIASSRRGGLPLRTYRCPDCKGWHLTKRREWHEVPAPVRVPEARHPNGHRRSCPCGQCAWRADATAPTLAAAS